MIEIQAPKRVPAPGKKIFLAGAITGAPEWQSDLLKKLEPLQGLALNPRRENFPIDDPSAAEVQITWEFDMLKDSDVISFWFPKETVAPIALLELGKWLMSSKPLVIGVHPKYERRQDVEIQTGLQRPDIKIVYSLEDLSDQIASLWNEFTF
jgi:hypothetical protein